MSIDHAAIKEIIKNNPRKMTMQIANELKVPEAEVIRCMPPEQVTELDAAQWEPVIRGFEPLGKVHVICTNGAVTLEANGIFGEFSTWGEFFNVQTPTLDMHIRPKNIASIFAVEKPSHMDGVNTLSVHFYDLDGRAAFKVFLNFGAAKAEPAREAFFVEVKGKYKKA